MDVRLIEESPWRFRIERTGDMRVPGTVFAPRELLPLDAGDKSLEQVANVATLPGIVRASFAMPDIHWGYGFPIGGVAATDVDAGGVVSPGGVGFDISCGVRLLGATVDRRSLMPHLPELMDRLDHLIPRGLGRGALWRPGGRRELHEVLRHGARYAVERGHGVPRDLQRCEDYGAVDDADPTQVSERALERGGAQVGSVGSANHFLEIQVVEKVYDESCAQAFGLHAGQVCVMIHCGSRGLGHQICSDHVRAMGEVMHRYGISLPDKQLACVPVHSHEGRAYLGAMAAAANYARANRQLLGDEARRVFGELAGAGLDLVYDVSHNVAKLETREVDGARKVLCVHRKGATRALPPGHPDLPPDLVAVGQPVFVPGTMGTASYVLTGVTGNEAFDSSCHGAGRVWSRHRALREVTTGGLRTELALAGVAVRPTSWRSVKEEAPEAYKDVDAVVTATAHNNLGRLVVRLVPIGVLKG
ncbi:RNA-splicing ligase RtcB [Kitasatospora atroaurantiaca]|uniref:tRNA-splicing ligase RtcB n=1 Tax=Kitasatospora atroaurantiaca TaxID=285545 RepID=A0A561ETA4_9ACTN|nr:RtcB family protein [Kitasatospora atroaurantiaca]TWE18835.1 tRNA-splicing ligase RtcB [Kitasatospora atroaurantiaca]